MADYDSEMLSSSPDSPTPQQHAPTHRDLSPPASQPQRHSGTPPPPYSSVPGVAESTAAAGAGQSQQQQQAKEQQQPGASWMNPRAQEEYNRAMEHVVDQDFSLKCFGDLYDERELE
ncbi:hypothetical protein VTN49DRAFT_7437 [Thermomyces lanuginosus]|uniref:uncharacterized protein n=1 Tax=Thermomyces lanuginosus TaxID=5541 RepID=UPI0037431521